MPLNIQAFIREKKSEHFEAQIKKKGKRVSVLATEARQSKRFNAMARTEKKLKKEVAEAKKERRASSPVGKATAALKKFKKSREGKEGTGAGGIFMNTGSGRGPFG